MHALQTQKEVGLSDGAEGLLDRERLRLGMIVAIDSESRNSTSSDWGTLVHDTRLQRGCQRNSALPQTGIMKPR